MSYVKNLSVDFTPAQQTAITDALNAALVALNAVVIVTLTAEERRTIPTVEANRFQYIDKAVFTLGPDFPSLISRAVTTAKAVDAANSYNFLTQVLALVVELNDRATDARHNLGNTTYNYTLDMYHEAQRYVGDLPGADTIVDELRPLFENQGPENDTTPNP